MPISHATLDVLSDDRGTVCEPLACEEIGHQKNVHVVTSGPGVVRGNHYHVKGTETIVVMGPVLVRFREGGADRAVAVAENQVYRFVFPPKVPHAIKNTSDKTNMLVAFNTEPHDPDRPDTVRAVLI